MFNLNILIDADLHRAFKMAAVRNNTTMTAIITEYIKEYLEHEEISNNTIRE